MKKAVFGALAFVVASLVLAGPAGARTTAGNGHQVYTARLSPMNTEVTGHKATAEAKLTVNGDTLTISIKAQGVPPGVVHWQHLHGFKDNRAASCPTAAADINHDGIIDLIETEPMSGTTMVPFDSNPAGMDIAHGKYPTASAHGTYDYHKTVSLQTLQAAFSKAFGDQKLDLDKRVIFIHGVPASTKLPASVASLGPIPAQVVLPIACGKIERAGR
jgi:hypothetical protein